MMKNTELQATFEGENQRWGDTILAVCKAEDGSFLKLKTKADPEELLPGLTYRFYGHWRDHFKYGRQFEASTFVRVQPHDEGGIKAYLQRAPWVGPKVAKLLWSHYQGEAVKALRTDPAGVAGALDLRNFSAQRAQESAAYLEEEAATEDATIDLMDLLAGKGFPRATLKKAIRLWGNCAAQVVRRDPYKLILIPGCGFLRTDQLYLELGHSPARLKRQILCMWHAMHTDTEGHTWFPPQMLERALAEKIGSAEVQAVKAARIGLRAGLFAIYREPNCGFGGGRWLTDAPRSQVEQDVADRVAAMLARPPTWPAIDGLDISPHQAEQLARALVGRVATFGGSPGTGKAQPLDAKIVTPNGYKAMGDIKIGDEIMNSSGGISKVIGIFPQGEKTIYRVTFSDGSSTECCEDHLWLTTRRDQRKRKEQRKSFLVQPLKEIAATLKDRYGSSNHSIPITTPVEFPKRALPLDPYLLGLLIGDGCLCGTGIGFSKPDAEILNSIRKLLPRGVNLIHRSGIDHTLSCAMGQKNPLIAILKNLGLWGKRSHEKHIPESYLLSSVEDRIAILQGLMDTDGYTDGCVAEFSTSSPVLASQFQFLVESLGGTTQPTARVPHYVHNGERREGKTSYRFCACLPKEIIPFRLSRKRGKFTPRSKYQPRRVIRKIEMVGQRPAMCIAVDATDQLYLTDHYIVTHNTYTAARLIGRIQEQGMGGGSIAVVAPTGKAAVRITEALLAYGLNLKARTIHSYLGVQKADDGGVWTFGHDESNPVEERFVVVDESSMIDTALMSALLRALPLEAHLLLVGDVQQLPPVGHGAPLRDLVAAGVPAGELREIRRNSGAIVSTCAQIRDESSFQIAPKLDLDAGVNLILQETRDGMESLERIVSLVRKVRDLSLADPVWETQVIVAVNEKSPLSRVDLNRILQAELNVSNRGTGKFWPADKVVCLKNGFWPASRDSLDAYEEEGDEGLVRQNEQGETELYVANGELGRVLEEFPNKTILEFFNPCRVILVPRGEDGTPPFDLGYSVSCHKSQGSEWPIVIVAIDDYYGAKMVCDRSWIYTAISRAKKACILVGQERILHAMVQRQKIHLRKTFLVERLIAARARYVAISIERKEEENLAVGNLQRESIRSEEIQDTDPDTVRVPGTVCGVDR